MFASPGSIAFQIPEIFGFGPFPVRWYGILMATAIVVGLWWAHRQARREGLPADDIINAGQWAILAGLLGARAYEVIFNWDYYGQHPSKIPAVWEGGLAMHGGLIVAPLVSSKWHTAFTLFLLTTKLTLSGTPAIVVLPGVWPGAVPEQKVGDIIPTCAKALFAANTRTKATSASDIFFMSISFVVVVGAFRPGFTSASPCSCRQLSMNRAAGI
ncbi:MAG: hypothetical protein DME02_24765 [Candidatus Rokuibacteriota bacterium]|nr:MAG: hypothetical protein DME02_24765 [Candidatus Rokubacteria bacterium]